MFAAPLIRVGSVLAGTLAVVLLTYRFQLNDSPRLMITILLILIIVNAAFRSLFPLLLDPHNLYLPSSI
jgi:cytochrome bd-type quinol oxidase subunit 2